MTLESPSLERELAELQGELLRAKSDLEQLAKRRSFDDSADSLIPQRQEELHKLVAREKVVSNELSKLQFVAPHDGWLIDGNDQFERVLGDTLDDRFVSTALDEENEFCWVKRSHLIGWFSGRRKPIVIALMPEHLLKGINVGQVASIKRDSDVFDLIIGKVVAVMPDAIESVPEVLLGDATLVSVPSTSGYFETETPHYQVVIELETEQPLVYGSPATVSIKLAAKPIYQQVYDFLRRSFRLRPQT